MLKALGLLCLVLVTQSATAETATVAVASNFKPTLERLQHQFERIHPHELRIVNASSGILYNQILHGARFDVFLSADSQRPLLLEKAGIGITGTRVNYALGQLALTGKAVKQASDFVEDLTTLNGKLAIANPDLAPYGLAAEQTLRYLNLWDALGDRIVMGSNIGQANQFVATGNAPMGLIALPLILKDLSRPTYRVIPADWHEPILQQAILTKTGQDNTAAVDFLRYLQSDQARQIIAEDGFLLPGVE